MSDTKDKLDQVTKIGQEIDRGKPSAADMTDTKPTLGEQIDKYGLESMKPHILASLEELKRIHEAEMPDCLVADVETTARIDAAAKGGIVIGEYPARRNRQRNGRREGEMKPALMGICPETKQVVIVAINNDDTATEIHQSGLIMVPCELATCKKLFNETIDDIYEATK
jgi:hypothetical protein